MNEDNERNAYNTYRAQVKREAKFGTLADLLAKTETSRPSSAERREPASGDEQISRGVGGGAPDAESIRQTGRGAMILARMLDTDVAIETPEHIVFPYRVAGPARRALGHVLDLLVCYGAIALLGLIVLLAGLRGIDTGDIGTVAKAGVGIILVALFAAQWIYFVVCEAIWGRSPGKMAVGVRVVTTLGRADWVAGCGAPQLAERPLTFSPSVTS